MKRLFFLTMFLFLYVCMLSYAQDAKISIASEKSPTRGYLVRITNNHQSPLTAWAVASVWTTGVRFEWKDTAINYLSYKPIAPNETRQFTIGSGRTADEEPSSRLLGALFADGRSSGEADWVDQMIAARKRILDDIPKAADILRRAKGETTKDRFTMVSQFKKRSEESGNSVQKALQDQITDDKLKNNQVTIMQIAARRVAGQVATNLEMNPVEEDGLQLAQLIDSILGQLERWQMVLQNSLTLAQK